MVSRPQDNDVPLERLVAPWRNRSVAEVRAQARQALMPVDVADDRQYYISVPHGHVLQKEVCGPGPGCILAGEAPRGQTLRRAVRAPGRWSRFGAFSRCLASQAYYKRDRLLRIPSGGAMP